MTVPIEYAFSNTGVFDSFDGVNFVTDSNANGTYVNTSISAMGNCVFINAQSIMIGNSTVFNTLNSTAWTGISNSTFLSSDSFGNSTVNSMINSTSMSIVNSTANAVVNTSGFYLDGSALNAGQSFTQFEFLATAGQTTFSGADQNSVTLAYSPGLIQVYINGNLLDKADFTASNGTSVILAQAVNLNDQVTIMAYTSFNVANVLTPAHNLSDVSSTTAARQNLGLPGILRGYLFGVTLSTAGSSSTFSIAAGVANDSTFTDFMSYAGGSKTTSAWAVGSGNGSLDTGSITASTWYHVYVIKRTDTGIVDILISLSATSPTMPTNYTLFRRIGSMLTDGSSHWTLFIQKGNTFIWAVLVTSLSAGTAAGTPTLFTVATPLGIQTDALLNYLSNYNSSSGYASLWPPDMGTAGYGGAMFAGGTVLSTAIQGGGYAQYRTNTSSQLYYATSTSGVQLSVYTFGWIDTRGTLY